MMDDIKRLEGRYNTLLPFELEDLADSQHFAKAMEVMFGYYFTREEAQAIIKGTRNVEEV
jgi:hypothetical protein